MTWIVGGTIGGYCAIGSEKSATPPPSVMTMDNTVAKIGRSMKNRDSTVGIDRQRSEFGIFMSRECGAGVAIQGVFGRGDGCFAPDAGSGVVAAAVIGLTG